MAATAIYISDPEAVADVDRLAKLLGLDKTATIRTLAREKLAILGQPFTDEKPKPRDGDLADLEERCRRDTRDYLRLRREKTGKKGGTRVYLMLKRHGPVEAYVRLVMNGPGEGLRFLAEQNRLDLSAEQAVLDYPKLFPAEVRKRAEENIAWALEIQRE